MKENLELKMTSKENRTIKDETLFEELSHAENIESIEDIFNLHTELKRIGTQEQYERYVKSIFPESVLHKIMWHGTLKERGDKDNIINKGFDPNKALGLDLGYEFYGIYFGDRYSHYGGPNMDSIAVILNIRNPRIIDNDNEHGLSALDMTKGIKATYNLKDEDGLIQINHFEGNDHLSMQEFSKRVSNLEEKVKGFLPDNPTFQDILNLARKYGMDWLPLHEVAVFDPSQIHILGSTPDIELFKNFIRDDTKE